MNHCEVVEAWMSLLDEFSWCFTEPGRRRFGALATGGLLCERRPLVSEIVSALGLESQWRAVEAFLEYGAWPVGRVEEVLAQVAAACARSAERQIWALSRPEGAQMRQEDMGRLLVSRLYQPLAQPTLWRSGRTTGCCVVR